MRRRGVVISDQRALVYVAEGKLTAEEYVIYSLIVSTRDKNDECRYAIASLAELVHKRKTFVIEAIRKLEALGLLIPIRAAGQATVYLLPDPFEEADQFPGRFPAGSDPVPEQGETDIVPRNKKRNTQTAAPVITSDQQTSSVLSVFEEASITLSGSPWLAESLKELLTPLLAEHQLPAGTIRELVLKAVRTTRAELDRPQERKRRGLKPVAKPLAFLRATLRNMLLQAGLFPSEEKCEREFPKEAQPAFSFSTPAAKPLEEQAIAEVGSSPEATAAWEDVLNACSARSEIAPKILGAVLRPLRTAGRTLHLKSVASAEIALRLYGEILEGAAANLGWKLAYAS